MLDREIASSMALFPARDPAQMTPDRAREALLARRAARKLTAPACTVSNVLIDVAQTTLAARIYRPNALPAARPTIVFFHGGGWVAGDLDTHDLQARELCTECDAVVVSVDYRRPPEHRFPCAFLDCLAATEWVAENLATLGGGTGFGVAGDSAGGNLAAAVALARRGNHPALSGQLLAYPVTDARGAYASDEINQHYVSRSANAADHFLSLDMISWYARQYLGANEPGTDPRVSPLLSETLVGAPSAIICTAQLDPLRDEGKAYAEALLSAGVFVDFHDAAGLPHGFFGMGHISTAARLAAQRARARFSALLHRPNQAG